MATASPHRPPQDIEALLEHSKQPLTPVAGPYGHPFHPILVTIPIGAWVSSLVFDIASRANSDGSTALVDGAHWLIAIGVIGALVAALFGLMDLVRIPRGTKAFKAGLTHMSLNLVIVAMFIANFFWRDSDYTGLAKVRVGQLVLSAVAIALLLASGWIGGMLSYKYGVRVAREDTQATGYVHDGRASHPNAHN
jgi:uncharacterized membrane protein